jgi:hypothetical protein
MLLDGTRHILLIYKEPKFWGFNMLKPTTVSNQRREPDW